jgi:hypothetical protein
VGRDFADLVLNVLACMLDGLLGFFERFVWLFAGIFWSFVCWLACWNLFERLIACLQGVFKCNPTIYGAGGIPKTLKSVEINVSTAWLMTPLNLHPLQGLMTTSKPLFLFLFVLWGIFPSRRSLGRYAVGEIPLYF